MKKILCRLFGHQFKIVRSRKMKPYVITRCKKCGELRKIKLG